MVGPTVLQQSSKHSSANQSGLAMQLKRESLIKAGTPTND